MAHPQSLNFVSASPLQGAARCGLAEPVPPCPGRGTHVAKVRGQWRISGLPADFGPYLTQTDFERIYTPYRVYAAETTTKTPSGITALAVGVDPA